MLSEKDMWSLRLAACCGTERIFDSLSTFPSWIKGGFRLKMHNLSKSQLDVIQERQKTGTEIPVIEKIDVVNDVFQSLKERKWNPILISEDPFSIQVQRNGSPCVLYIQYKEDEHISFLDIIVNDVATP